MLSSYLSSYSAFDFSNINLINIYIYIYTLAEILNYGGMCTAKVKEKNEQSNIYEIKFFSINLNLDPCPHTSERMGANSFRDF